MCACNENTFINEPVQENVDVVAEEVISEPIAEQEEIVEEPEKDSQMDEIRNDIFGALEENKRRNESMTEEERRRELEEERQKEAEAKRLQELRAIEERVNQKEYEKTLKKQEALNKKEMKKAEREYKEKYKEAYVTELRNRGYNVKYPWTWKRVKNLLIGIIATILVIVVAWQIPMVREPLIDLYNENVIIKTLVDVVGSILNAIFGVFKSN